MDKNKECPENYKSCGIVDTLERKFCVNNNDDFPINMIDISDKNLNLPYQYESFPIGYGYNLFYSNNNNNNDGQIFISI